LLDHAFFACSIEITVEMRSGIQAMEGFDRSGPSADLSIEVLDRVGGPKGCSGTPQNKFRMPCLDDPTLPLRFAR